ncbi:helix-turn-helix domain-containing protein [Sediminicola luteus]|uniref:DNA-binding protein n=1 Tax=Sediminicola luteus TaxID=319238 RepID=A0A2A4G5J1_9FLAO|nr:helix-turn-helix domain-containing protein [Sediminicola luteus]PCE63015.1 DNA-binding protein [Sediminicola luteus]
MPANIVTTEDLKVLREEILEGVIKILEGRREIRMEQWVKSNTLMDILKISPGTLQNLRANGTIPYTRLGRLIYYNLDEVQRIMADGHLKGKRS